ncbi:LemA family protein [Aliikangiella marina]|nr:LemA family protein [Aliikangiella marina]
MNTDNPLVKILLLFIAVIFSVGGWTLANYGFDSIQKIRQIDRLPNASIAAAIPGEVKINATVSHADKYVSSRHYKIPSIYYLYRYEEEEVDSDGNRYWDTKFENSQASNFYLKDKTGEIYVDVSTLLDTDIHFSLPITSQDTYGDVRHTEWRIEPDDHVFVMAYLRKAAATQYLSFLDKGQYTPTISKYDESYEKSSIGMSIILMIAGGISLIALAVFFLTSGLSIHRVLAFLILLSLAVFIPLTHLGISMLYDDVLSGQSRIKTQMSASILRINQLTGLDIQSTHDASRLVNSAENLSQTTLNITNEILENIAYGEKQYLRQLKVFPNNLIAFLYTEPNELLFDSLIAPSKSRVTSRLLDYQKTKTDGILPQISIGVGLAICILMTWLGFRLIRLKRHIENIPTSKTSGVVFGLSEVKGRIKPIAEESPLRSPLTNTRCYWYFYKVEEKRQRGKETEWVTIEKRIDFKPFLCQDAHGQIKVMPLHAEVISQHKKVERRGQYRYTEKVLRLDDEVYVLGHTKIDRDVGDKLVFRSNKEDKPFLITNFSERAIMLRKAQTGMISLTAAFSAIIFAALFYLGMQGSFSPADYLMAALIAPVYMSIIILILHYNDLIFLRQRAARNLSNIGVSLQKRVELIPNLEKIVKKYLSHEKVLLKKLTELRTSYVTKTDNFDSVSAQLKQEQVVLTQMIAKAEDYPELKSHKLNVKLMNRLIDLENEISLMREGYNDAVTYFNTRIASVPDVFFAKAFGFVSMDLFHFESKHFSRLTVKFD